MKRIEKLLRIDFEDRNQPWIHSSFKLRQTIGVLGMLLPGLLWFSLVLFEGVAEVLPSISHYYFTRSGTIFTATLIVLATFLLIFKDDDKLEFWLSTLAGLFALFVAIFPTDNLVDRCCDLDVKHAITFLSGDISGINPRVLFHYVSAGLFFLCLAFMSFIIFPRSEESGHDKNAKNRRKIIYRVCAVVMVVSILIILLNYNDSDANSWYNRNQMTFWLEVIAVEAFGISWFIRGETLFKDKPKDITAE